MKKVLYVLVIIAAGGLVYLFLDGSSDDESLGSGPSGTAIASVQLPDALSEHAEIGRNIFEVKCAVCHGESAAGKEGVAPPLVHKIYEPSHHGDESFQRAVAMGTRQHHWPFGNMPAVPGLGREDVAAIVTYVRALQVENGIN